MDVANLTQWLVYRVVYLLCANFQLFMNGSNDDY